MVHRHSIYRNRIRTRIKGKPDALSFEGKESKTGGVCRSFRGKGTASCVSEVMDGKAAGACGCEEVVSGVGEEGGEKSVLEEMIQSRHYVCGYLRHSTHR